MKNILIIVRQVYSSTEFTSFARYTNGYIKVQVILMRNKIYKGTKTTFEKIENKKNVFFNKKDFRRITEKCIFW